MSVLLVNPMVAPQVRQTALALYEAGLLHRFITTVHHDSSARWQRTAKVLFRAIGYDLEAQLLRRTLSEVPPDLVESIPWGELLRLAIAKLDPTRVAGDVVWEITEREFGRAAARRVRPPVNAVYSYEYCALPVFNEARRRNARVIYETPAAEPRFAFETMRREMAKFPELEESFHRHEARHEERRIRHRRSEWEAADLVIANSCFTRSTYADAGLDTSKVRIVHLGAPPPVSPEIAAVGGGDPTGPLRLVWAGKFGVMKGAHYLLDAWRKGGFARHAQLDVFGLQSLPRTLMRPAPDGIVFHGIVSRAELFGQFAAADALVFPTLSDGFGMVATEAWAQGLPVITTRNAGMADLLRPGENGLITAAGDSQALAATLQWCLEHRKELRAMRRGAQATAAAWQWSDYRKALIEALAPTLAGPQPP